MSGGYSAVVAQTIRGTTAFASANADGHARYADGYTFAIAGHTTFSIASNEDEYAWDADATVFTFGVAENTNEHARYANADSFPKPASFP